MRYLPLCRGCAVGSSTVYGVLDLVIAAVVIVLIGVGFWYTRGAGGVPGGIGDPSREQLTKYSETGRPVDPNE